MQTEDLRTLTMLALAEADMMIVEGQAVDQPVGDWDHQKRPASVRRWQSGAGSKRAPGR